MSDSHPIATRWLKGHTEAARNDAERARRDGKHEAADYLEGEVAEFEAVIEKLGLVEGQLHPDEEK